MKRARMFVASALLAIVPIAAQTVELPTRKAGLWEISIATDDGKTPAVVMQHCTDPTTDKDMNSAMGPISREMCSKNEIEKTATGYVTSSVCNITGRPSTSRGKITGDFSSAYTMKIATHTDNPPAGMPADSRMTMNAKWTGPCKADQKPGDVIMPGGMKMNIKDMQALRGKK